MTKKFSKGGFVPNLAPLTKAEQQELLNRHYRQGLDAEPSALSTQIGGQHYKDQVIQPVEYIHANGIGYFEGNVIKYVSRWRKKNGVADLEKAKHYIELLIELETRNAHLEAQKGADTSRP